MNTTQVSSAARPVVTIELLNRLKSARGGYSRDTLQYLGIGWPPKRGWRKALIREAQENAANGIGGVAPEIKSSMSISHDDVIRARFLMLTADERLKLLESLRASYCFWCGKMKEVCVCES